MSAFLLAYADAEDPEAGEEEDGNAWLDEEAPFAKAHWLKTKPSILGFSKRSFSGRNMEGAFLGNFLLLAWPKLVSLL